MSLNVGLCQFGSALSGSLSDFDTQALARSAGGKLEYQINPRIGLSGAVSLEPATDRLFCKATQTSSSYIQTPYQLGFDLFKRWEF